MPDQRTHIARIILEQIGIGTVAAISGLRHGPITDGRPGVDLPVAAGYRVIVEYDQASDLYDVHRVFRRGGKDHPHGTAAGVWAGQLSEVAYRASCFRDRDPSGTFN